MANTTYTKAALSSEIVLPEVPEKFKTLFDGIGDKARIEDIQDTISHCMTLPAQDLTNGIAGTRCENCVARLSCLVLK